MPRLPQTVCLPQQKQVMPAALCQCATTFIILVIAPWDTTTAQTIDDIGVLPVKAVHNYCKDNCALDQFEALSSQTVHYLYDPVIRDWQSKCATFADMPSDLFVFHTSDGVSYQLDHGGSLYGCEVYVSRSSDFP
jgi:hypothetical protein